jgi:hypothetical protein
MHVKDYLQALADDNKIRVEKIGSGNWYWSFLSDEKKAKDTALDMAQNEYNKANATVAELQSRVDQAGAARADDEDILMETGKRPFVVFTAFIKRIKALTARHSSPNMPT